MAFNPVEQRLLGLCGYWETFRADPSKRLLIWQVPDNTMRLLQCFFEVQKHETPYSTNDLFIVFDAPFENSIQYSRALKEALAEQYDASREDLTQQGIAPDWHFAPNGFPDSAGGFIRSLCSFGSKYHKTIGHLVVVLTPSAIASESSFVAWLQRALDSNIPERLRLAVIDSIEAPRLKVLTDSGNELVHVDKPKIDALELAQETFAQEGAVGAGAVFRNFLMGLVTLVEKGSADQVKAKAADALAFARKEKWLDQEVVIAMLVAGALLKEKRFDKAVKTYQHSRQVAVQTVAANHPAGKQLVLQTWFGEAGVQLAAGDAKRAAECYDQAAVIAGQIPNGILAIEAFRMAAFCHARIEQSDAAIERSLAALAVGERLKPEVRGMTTLPLAAMDLLRVVEPERAKGLEAIKQRLDGDVQKSQAAAEQRAADLEKGGNGQQLRLLEEDLKRQMAAAEKKAAQELDAVAERGGKQFREFFAKGRALLGPEWPLFSAVAMPRAPHQGAMGASAP